MIRMLRPISTWERIAVTRVSLTLTTLWTRQETGVVIPLVWFMSKHPVWLFPLYGSCPSTQCGYSPCVVLVLAPSVVIPLVWFLSNHPVWLFPLCGSCPITQCGYSPCVVLVQAPSVVIPLVLFLSKHPVWLFPLYGSCPSTQCGRLEITAPVGWALNTNN